MRILILANIGLGLYNFRRELLEELVKKNEVYFCIPNDEFVEPIKKIGCNFVDNPFLERRGTNPVKDLKLISYYKKILREIKPKVVFTYTIKPSAYGGMACASLDVPYVVNITGLGTAIENGGLMQKISCFMYRRGLRKAQKVFFQNTENRDFMINHKVVTSPYDMLPGSGVNLDNYTVAEYPNGDTIDFVFVARIMKEKGIDQYIDAAKEIRKRHPNTRFHICGFCENDYEETLRKLTEEGIIIYHGLVKNMTEIYQQMSCTIHPTYYPEGLSNVLLESAASGRPIITTNRSGCREVVDDGVNGYVIEEKNSADLIEKIEKFLSLSFEERKKMGLEGRKKVEREFDRSVVIEKYIKELKMVK